METRKRFSGEEVSCSEHQLPPELPQAHTRNFVGLIYDDTTESLHFKNYRIERLELLQNLGMIRTLGFRLNSLGWDPLSVRRAKRKVCMIFNSIIK